MSGKLQQKLRDAGWLYDPADGFITLVGGLWRRQHGEGLEFGFIAGQDHANRNGMVHGGMLMTFVDRAFGMSSRLASGAPRAATISLNHQFMAPMQIGEFARVVPNVVKLTTRMAFVEGTVMRDDTALMGAQGVWRLARGES